MDRSDGAYIEQVSRALQLLQGKWTAHILFAMRHHPVRLSTLKRAIPRASKKALTASLRSLEMSGVIVRKDLSKSVLHVEYELAAGARCSLISLFDRLAAWITIECTESDDSELSSRKLTNR